MFKPITLNFKQILTITTVLVSSIVPSVYYFAHENLKKEYSTFYLKQEIERMDRKHDQEISRLERKIDELSTARKEEIDRLIIAFNHIFSKKAEK